MDTRTTNIPRTWTAAQSPVSQCTGCRAHEDSRSGSGRRARSHQFGDEMQCDGRGRMDGWTDADAAHRHTTTRRADWPGRPSTGRVYRSRRIQDPTSEREGGRPLIPPSVVSFNHSLSLYQVRLRHTVHRTGGNGRGPAPIQARAFQTRAGCVSVLPYFAVDARLACSEAV